MAGKLKTRALRLLATREHTRVELRDKLSGEDEAEELESVLDRLAELGLQSDARFADAFVRAKGQRFGAARLRHELTRRGVADALIASALAQMDEEGGLGDELSRAQDVWNRKFGKPPQDAKEWAKQARFLQSRGFSTGIIRQVLKESTDESAAGQ